MEAPFRFPITSFSNVERLLSALASSPDFVAGSLRLTEGTDLLARQLTEEKRRDDLDRLARANTAAGIEALLRSLWEHPLTAQRPRFLRIEASLAAKPSIPLSLRINVPTREALPRWIDLDVDRDLQVREQQLQALQSIGESAGLKLVAV